MQTYTERDRPHVAHAHQYTYLSMSPLTRAPYLTLSLSLSPLSLARSLTRFLSLGARVYLVFIVFT